MEASLYDELAHAEENHWWFQARRAIVWSLVERFADGGAQRRLRICELGCGTGGNLTAVAWKHEVVGIECSDVALAYARKKLGDRVKQGSLPNDVDLPNDRYDVVLLTDVLEHTDDDAASARTALRLLKPAGIAVATVPAYQWLYSQRDALHHHYRRYSKQQFRALWPSPGVEIELLSHYNTLLFPPAAAMRVAEKVFRAPGDQPTGDLHIPASPINRLLARTMASERNLIGRVPLPFGLSLVAVLRKPIATARARTAAPPLAPLAPGIATRQLDKARRILQNVICENYPRRNGEEVGRTTP